MRNIIVTLFFAILCDYAIAQHVNRDEAVKAAIQVQMAENDFQPHAITDVFVKTYYGDHGSNFEVLGTTRRESESVHSV